MMMVVSLLSAFTMIACSNDDDYSDVEKTIVGEWKLVKTKYSDGHFDSNYGYVKKISFSKNGKFHFYHNDPKNDITEEYDAPYEIEMDDDSQTFDIVFNHMRIEDSITLTSWYFFEDGYLCNGVIGCFTSYVDYYKRIK